MASAPDRVETRRLLLSRPVPADLDALFAINADPSLWTHFPALRHTAPEQTGSAMARWEESWATAGLGPWTVRALGDDEIVGYAGASLLGGHVWNIGYRFAARTHGKGYATEAATAAMEWAALVDAERPRIAYLLEHNVASAAVAARIGLVPVHRGPDAGNPDPAAVRVVYSDRPLSPAQLAATLR